MWEIILTIIGRILISYFVIMILYLIVRPGVHWMILSFVGIALFIWIISPQATFWKTITSHKDDDEKYHF
ncbi:MAG: hypothetical protein AAB969_00240 [Patescibacteria group bacterium]